MTLEELKAQAEAAGYRLVPVEPTEEMMRAWFAEEYRQHVAPEPDPVACYRAMLDAAGDSSSRDYTQTVTEPEGGLAIGALIFAPAQPRITLTDEGHRG